jgi:hypothetical protein
MLKTLRNSLLFVLAGLASAQASLAEDFSLAIGSPVAAGDFRAKAAVLAVRSRGCADPADLELSGAAEGLTGGRRQTVPLTHIIAMPAPGVFAVPHEWPREGAWVVHLIGRCGEATAGALVPIGRKTFLRESSKFFPRAAAGEEIEAALEALTKALSQEAGTNP